MATPILMTPTTLADLATKVGRPPTDAKLLVALRAASGRFRGAVEWQVHRVVDERMVVDGTGTRDLRLAARDVVDVRRVRVLGQDVEVEWSAHGLMRRLDAGLWPARFRAVEVTLTYGHDPIPDDIAEAVRDQAEAIFNIIRGVQSTQVGGITVTNGVAEATGVTQAWVDATNRYHLRGRA